MNHAKGFKECLAQIRLKRHPCDDLDKSALNGLVDAIEIVGARLEHEGVFRARLNVRLEVIESRLVWENCVESNVWRVHWFVAGTHVVSPAGTVRHQVNDAQRLCTRPDLVAVAPRELGHAGDILGNFVVPVELTLLVQCHHRNGRDWLRHRPDGEQGVGIDIAVAFFS